MLITINEAVYTILNESVLRVVFKHRITFYLVGLILSGSTSFFGLKLGRDIGKLLYALVAIGVVGILNFIMMIFTLVL
ncbi:MAG: hypothetical protein CVV57_01585 [Tenericutes bacterium HGW-Tenericutes-2]|nr:MAG: hypothetical protein CVV57_01585 [Tenericutes bacterium HGW-Tenericutes-2]